MCDETSKWKSVDQYRLKPSGMSICMNCGFVSYPQRYKSMQDAKNYYLKEYRKNSAPSVMNLYTGQRKLHYHAHFLRDLIDQWGKEEFHKPVICEVGAAFGMVLNWFKKQCFPNAEIYGTEWDLAMRRNAWHEWKIKLDEDFDPSRKYDLIMTYKVAEHQSDADVRLREYAESLTDKGRVYVSVPIWFDTLNNFGKQGFELEYYYHPDHINVWTRKLFETVLAKAGLEIVKDNHTFYDSSYLCKRNDALMTAPKQFEDPKDVIDSLDKIFRANQAGMDGDYDKAVEIYPNFPYGWEGKYEKNRSKIHAKGFEFIFENYLKPALDACPTSAETRLLVGDICMRYEKFKDAIKFLELSLRMKPENSEALGRIAKCFREMSARTSDREEKKRLRLEARNVERYRRDVSKQDEPDAISWIYNDNAKIEAPYEQASAVVDSTRVTGNEAVSGFQGQADDRMRAEP